MNTGTKGWVSVVATPLQLVAQAFALTSPLASRWSQLLLMHGHCLGQAMLHNGRGEVQGISGNICNLHEPP